MLRLCCGSIRHCSAAGFGPASEAAIVLRGGGGLQTKRKRGWVQQRRRRRRKSLAKVPKFGVAGPPPAAPGDLAGKFLRQWIVLRETNNLVC